MELSESEQIASEMFASSRADSALPQVLGDGAKDVLYNGYKVTVQMDNSRKPILDPLLHQAAELSGYKEMRAFLAEHENKTYNGVVVLRLFTGNLEARDKAGTLVVLTPPKITTSSQGHDTYEFIAAGALHCSVETVDGRVKLDARGRLININPLTCTAEVDGSWKSNFSMASRGKVHVLELEGDSNVPDGSVELPCGTPLDLLGSPDANVRFYKVIYNDSDRTTSPIATKTVREPIIDPTTGKQRANPNKTPMSRAVKTTPVMVPSTLSAKDLADKSVVLFGYAGSVSEQWVRGYTLTVEDMSNSMLRAAEEVKEKECARRNSSSSNSTAAHLQLVQRVVGQCAHLLQGCSAALLQLRIAHGAVERRSTDAADSIKTAAAYLVELAGNAHKLDVKFLQDQAMPALHEAAAAVTAAAATSLSVGESSTAPAPDADDAGRQQSTACRSFREIVKALGGQANTVLDVSSIGPAAVPTLMLQDASQRLNDLQDAVLHHNKLTASPGTIVEAGPDVLLHTAPVIPGFSGAPVVDLRAPSCLLGLNIQSRSSPFDPCSYAVSVLHPNFAARYIKHVLPFMTKCMSRRDIGEADLLALHAYVDLFKHNWIEWGVTEVVESFKTTLQCPAPLAAPNQ